VLDKVQSIKTFEKEEALLKTLTDDNKSVSTFNKYDNLPNATNLHKNENENEKNKIKFQISPVKSYTFAKEKNTNLLLVKDNKDIGMDKRHDSHQGY